MFNKCYSVYYRESYPFDKLAKSTQGVNNESQIIDKDSFLLLHGGTDISPTIYGAKRHKFTDVGSPSQRDLLEITCVKRAIAIGIPIMGICRGAQLLCALNGGKLVQHVVGHNGHHHMVKTYDGRTLTTNSVHHQMMFPWGTDYELVAWSKGVSPTYQGEDQKEVVFPEEAFEDEEVKEPEMIWFPKMKAFGVQGHPEWARDMPIFQQYVIDEFTKRI
jgi:carbamoylphosphate synthase small subunit